MRFLLNSKPRARHRAVTRALLFLALTISFAFQTRAQQTASASPSETVRKFYAALRERRFREAFEMSVYRPAIEGLSAAEMEDLRPDFEIIARNVPEKVEITGEQISGDEATVFLKLGDAPNGAPNIQPVLLRREKGAWTIDDPAIREAVKREGKNYFFNQRIAAHEADAEEMLQRIARAELAYALQHNGVYADMRALIDEGLLPKDIETPESTGYRYRITLGKDAKTFIAQAEPEKYGRTGRNSFYLDPKGAQKKDVGGKSYKPKS
jgi:hypothetical protein